MMLPTYTHVHRYYRYFYHFFQKRNRLFFCILLFSLNILRLSLQVKWYSLILLRHIPPKECTTKHLNPLLFFLMGVCIISRFYYSSVELIIFIRVLLLLRDRFPEMGHGNTVAKDVYMFIHVCVYIHMKSSL